MLSGIVELASFAAFVVAGWLVSPIAGLVVLGVVLWVLAQALDGAKVPMPRVRVPAVKVPRVRWPKTPSVGARES